MTDTIEYWTLQGRSRSDSQFRSSPISPDGQESTDLRHYWTDRTGTEWLTVIGPTFDVAHEEYKRLWAARSVG